MAAGLVAGLSLLTKDVMLFYFPFVVFWFFLWKETWKARFFRAGVFLIGFLAAVGPWMIRNSLMTGHLVFIMVSAGHTFYFGNNADFSGGRTGGDLEFGRDSVYPQAPDQPPLYTVEADRYLFRKAVRFIWSHPRRVVGLMGLKILNMWRPYQTDSPLFAQWAAALTYLPVLGLGLFGMFQNRNRWMELFPVFSLVAYFFCIHIILIAVIRYRYPVMPFFMVFAAASLRRFSCASSS